MYPDAEQCVFEGVLWHRYDSLDQFQTQQAIHQTAYAGRAQWTHHLAACCHEPGEYAGWCGVCAKPNVFSFATHPKNPNVREALLCDTCQLNARLRATFNLLASTCPRGNKAQIYLTEQATSFYRHCKHHWPQVRGSEYFPESMRLRLTNYLHCLIHNQEVLCWEDVCALSFKDRSIDHIISCEVLEHVPNYKDALAELARVLKPGGSLIVTVPFLDGCNDTLTRARCLDDGTIEHLCQPEYHGDPVNGEGILAFYHFGWDLLDELRGVGFSKAQWCLPWAPAQGLFTGLWTLQAIR